MEESLVSRPSTGSVRTSVETSSATLVSARSRDAGRRPRRVRPVSAAARQDRCRSSDVEARVGSSSVRQTTGRGAQRASRREPSSREDRPSAPAPPPGNSNDSRRARSARAPASRRSRPRARRLRDARVARRTAGFPCRAPRRPDRRRDSCPSAGDSARCDGPRTSPRASGPRRGSSRRWPAEWRDRPTPRPCFPWSPRTVRTPPPARRPRGGCAAPRCASSRIPPKGAVKAR